MKKSQIVFLSMCRALDHLRTKYQDRINSDNLLSRLFDEFFVLYDSIQDAIAVQEGHTSEAAKQKQKEETEMIEATVRLAAKGYVYAVEAKLPGLQEKFNITSWNLRNMSDVKLHATCMSIYKALSEIDQVAILEYGVTPELLNGLLTEINEFNALISQPRADIITRSQATGEISAKIKKMKDLLTERLDKTVQGLPESDAMFQNEYRATRIMIGMRGKKSNEDNQPDSPSTPEPKK